VASCCTWPLGVRVQRPVPGGVSDRYCGDGSGCARGDFTGDPAVSTEITYEADVEADASAERLCALVEDVDRIARSRTLCGAGRGFGLPGRMLCPRRLDSDARWLVPACAVVVLPAEDGRRRTAPRRLVLHLGRRSFDVVAPTGFEPALPP
jgi:hypothetical protein